MMNKPICGTCQLSLLPDLLIVTHKVVLGWKGSVSFLHATGLGGLTLTPNTKARISIISHPLS